MLGDKLIKLRKKQGFSEQEVADSLGVSRQTISDWESDQGAPSLDEATELAGLYKVDVNDLLSDEVEVVVAAGEAEDSLVDLHVPALLEGKTCLLGCDDAEMLLCYGNTRVHILEVSPDWIKIEFQRPKNSNPLQKETVIQLIETSAMTSFTILEEEDSV